MDTEYLSWERHQRALHRRLVAAFVAFLLVAAALAIPAIATVAVARAADAGAGTGVGRAGAAAGAAGTAAAPAGAGGIAGASTTGTIATYTGAAARVDQLFDPFDVATDGTYLYVVDAGRDRIVKYVAKTLRFVKALGPAGRAGAAPCPTAIAVAGGYAYVTDSSNHRVVRFATGRFDGTGWKAFDVERKVRDLGSLHGIAVAGGWVYVTYERYTSLDVPVGYVARFDARRLDGTGWKAYHGGSPADMGMLTPESIAIVGGTAYVSGDDDIVSFAADLSGRRWARLSTFVHDDALSVTDTTGIAAIGGRLYVAGKDLVVADIPFRRGGKAGRVDVPFGSQAARPPSGRSCTRPT